MLGRNYSNAQSVSGKCDFSTFQSERVFAVDISTPADEGSYIRLIFGRNAVQIFPIRDQLGCYACLFTA
jgi:hypothetical protein